VSDENPTLKDIWRALGTMNRRFDSLEREMIRLREDVELRMADLGARMAAGFGALKGAIEARNFRLDEHGRRSGELEAWRDRNDT
jgi:hypothetical protein